MELPFESGASEVVGNANVTITHESPSSRIWQVMMTGGVTTQNQLLGVVLIG